MLFSYTCDILRFVHEKLKYKRYFHCGMFFTKAFLILQNVDFDDDEDDYNNDDGNDGMQPLNLLVSWNYVKLGCNFSCFWDVLKWLNSFLILQMLIVFYCCRWTCILDGVQRMFPWHLSNSMVRVLWIWKYFLRCYVSNLDQALLVVVKLVFFFFFSF